MWNSSNYMKISTTKNNTEKTNFIKDKRNVSYFFIKLKNYSKKRQFYILLHYILINTRMIIQ